MALGEAAPHSAGQSRYPAVQEDRVPCTLGRDVSGVVENCGARATLIELGDEVLGIVDRRRLCADGASTSAPSP
jgi:NADPH:quinone reductase-like Zn-dependent oxidoreductase